MQSNGTLLHEVTLKISTNDCSRISVTRAFSILQWSAIEIGPSPTYRFMEWRHSWTFSGLWTLNQSDVWFMFCSSLSKELVHFCATKYFWLDLMPEKWLCNNGNYRECLHFTVYGRGGISDFRTGIPGGPTGSGVAQWERLSSCENAVALAYYCGQCTLQSRDYNCDSTTIRLRHDYDEKWHVHFLLASNRVEWKQTRTICRSRIVVVS